MEITSAQICEDLINLIGRTKAGVVELAAELQLTPIQMFTLYTISKGEGNMGKVAHALHCDASNVTGIVDRLVSQGLVVRQESEHDRRAKTLQLTPKGEEVKQKVLDRLPDYLGCDRLTSQERQVLHDAICKLMD
jgi:DNA-binding MarR family transcriptional regulator